MKKSQRLQLIVDLNAQHEKKALVALGKTQVKRQEALVQLDNLQEYLQEYKDKFQALSEQGVNISQLVEFRSFIHKLEKALEDQQKVVDEIDKDLSFARKIWERQHQKTQSLKKVCHSAEEVELKLQSKAEQNEQDDRASRSGRGNGTGNA